MSGVVCKDLDDNGIITNYRAYAYSFPLHMTKGTTQNSSNTLKTGDRFHFNCRQDLACFNKCCRDINLYLTPYDILRIKKRLAMHSAEFLRIYTVPLFPLEIGHPVVILKMIPDETKNCPFVSNDGCLIYEDRPWSCRSFPLEPTPGRTPEYSLVKRDFCEGFGRGKEHLVKQWRDSQHIAFYEEINDEWKKITHHDQFTSKNFLEGKGRDIFFIGSYNIDEFRDIVFKSDFLTHFSIEKKVLKKIKSNETELLRFAFKWMRTVLFGEEALKRK